MSIRVFQRKFKAGEDQLYKIVLANNIYDLHFGKEGLFDQWSKPLFMTFDDAWKKVSLARLNRWTTNLTIFLTNCIFGNAPDSVGTFFYI